MVNSLLVWSAEEAKYLKAIFRWQETADDDKRRRQAEEAERRQQQEQQKPAGEFRVLVIGGRGTGKTAILTRFGQGTFNNESDPPDPFYERGCRHPITFDVTPTATTTNPTSTKTQQPQKQTYIIDALEMPSKHLLSNPMLAQALSITEAAVLVYSVRDDASFRLAQGLAEFMRDYFSSSSSSSATAAPARATATSSSSSSSPSSGIRRLYPILLVGNKSDPPTCGADDDPVAILQEERAVGWTEGLKAARAMRMPGLGAAAADEGPPFLEVSAKNGEGVDQIFPVLGREVLRVRRLVRERRELAAEQERIMSEVGSVRTGGRGGGRRRFGLWRVLFGRRRVAGEGVR
ncbi:ras-related and estrogen-regulated growth inhibitor-like protein [Chaetomidium leptoderma]|uniref:Ras-related and estrogen-regulated growth inhibitor-like protein n=1 Tax=Chaetomidium leptoderma TaxID=669021 RepID=A0AAN6ZZ79_9PEZI|nr:ras-related and estrogen-regulated growth inhibitor-like protein [Chaetomidium leptoderma]